jgi:hypothetical protein
VLRTVATAGPDESGLTLIEYWSGEDVGMQAAPGESEAMQERRKSSKQVWRSNLRTTTNRICKRSSGCEFWYQSFDVLEFARA